MYFQRLSWDTPSKGSQFSQCLTINCIQNAGIQECGEQKWEIPCYKTILNYDCQSHTDSYIVIRQDKKYTNVYMHSSGRLIWVTIKYIAIIWYYAPSESHLKVQRDNFLCNILAPKMQKLNKFRIILLSDLYTTLHVRDSSACKNV